MIARIVTTDQKGSLMRKKQVLILIIVALVVAIATACGVTSSATTPQQDQPNSPSNALFAAVSDAADQYVVSEFPNLQPVGKWFLIPQNMQVRATCGTLYDTDVSYCPADNTVYVGEQLASDALAGDGIIGLSTVLGIGLGEYVQLEYDGTPVAPPGMQAADPLMIQADCYSGAFVRFLHQNGGIGGDPLVYHPRQTYLALEQARPAKAHNTVEERYLQYYMGAQNGTFVCDAH